MTAEADPLFSEATWAKVGEAVKLAGKIVECNPAQLVANIRAGRVGVGTEREHAMLYAITSMRQIAEAQIEMADEAIAKIRGCALLADNAALAALDAGAAH